MNDLGHIDPFSDDIGAWVLGALPEADAVRFAAHLETCDACAREVAELRVAVDHLPLVSAQVDPSPELKDRVMAVVRREAQLLEAAGTGADRPARAHDRGTRNRGVWGWIASRPLAASACAGVLLVAGLGIGIAVGGGGGGASSAPPRTLAASAPPRTLAAVSNGEARGMLITGAQDAELKVSALSAPSRGHVYQVWIRRGAGLPTPAGVFTVDLLGRGAVALRGSVAGAREVLVTEEPEGGSPIPSTEPLMRVALS